MNRKKLSFATAVLFASTAFTGAIPATAEEKPLEISVMTVNFGEAPTGKAVQEAWEAEMEKLMGREIEIDFQYISMADYSEKIKLLLASGELPDLFTTWGLEQSDLQEYGEEGVILNLADYLDQLPNYSAYLDMAPSSLSDLYTSDGGLYGFYAVETNWLAYSAGCNEINTSAAVRKDIFEENGIAIPQTVEEVYEAAKKLKEIYPDSYPIIQMEEWESPMDMLCAAYHIGGYYATSGFSGMYFDGTEYQYAPIHDGYRKALEMMNKWYSEGLISPDYFTQTQADGNAALASGQAMIIPSCWYGYPGQWSTSYPDQEWILIPGISDPEFGNPWIFNMKSADDVIIRNNWAVAVNAESDHVEELLKFMDLQMSDSVREILTWGVDGVTYTLDEEGNPQYTDEILENPSDVMAGFGLGTGTCRSGIFPQIQDKLCALQTATVQKNVNLDGTESENTVPGYIRDNFSVDYAVPSTLYKFDNLTADESEEIAYIITPVNTYAAEQMASFISGNRSFDEWDTYVEEVKSMGDIDRVVEIMNSKIGEAR